MGLLLRGTYSTHVIALAPVAGSVERIMVIPRADYEILDDWGRRGNDRTRGIASNTILAEDVFVPAHLTVPYDRKDFEMPGRGRSAPAARQPSLSRARDDLLLRI
jgi:hypothetical protein